VLLGFPLDFQDMTAEQRKNDLEFYEPFYAPSGPAMTQSMHTIGYVELKESDKADKFLNQSMQNMWEPFNVWTESHS
jgi:hypothetical protein